MSRRSAGRVAWSLWLLDVAVVIALSRGQADRARRRCRGSGLHSRFRHYRRTGASRIPANPVGWLLCLSALAFALGGISVSISEYAVRQGAEGVVVTGAAWLGTFVWMLGVGPAATFVLLLFPDGKLPSPRWLPVGWLAGAALGAITIAIALSPGPIEDTRVSNPIGISSWAGPLEVLEAAGLGLLFVCILASCASLIARYRGAGVQQRQQLKWLALSLPVVLGWIGASIWIESRLTGDAAADVANLLSSIGLTIVPVAIAVAILRHRLYDIDLVIKRTLVYSALTADLARDVPRRWCCSCSSA